MTDGVNDVEFVVSDVTMG